MKTLTRVDVIGLLRKAQGKKTVRAFAESLGLSPAYLSDVYHGNRNPGPTLLSYLGLVCTKTTQMVYTKRQGE